MTIGEILEAADRATHPLVSLARYGVGPDEYARQERELRAQGLPKSLTDISSGNPNMEDRYIGQYIAQKNNPVARWGGGALFNNIALGDYFLPDAEAIRTKQAGDLGRQMAEEPSQGMTLADILGGD